MEVTGQYLLDPDAPEKAYQSFPTVTRLDGGGFLVGFRQAETDPRQSPFLGGHGRRGDVRLVRLDGLGRPTGASRLVVDHRQEDTSEFDALVTNLGHDGVLLVTRTHSPEGKGSFFSLSSDGGETFPQRRALELSAPFGHALAACYGHALAGQAGAWLLPFYGGQDEEDPEATTAPGLARLDPAGGTAEVVGWLAEGETDDAVFNETAVVRLGDGRLLAMLRQEPCLDGLFVSWSDDDGREWTPPRPSGLFGEAANLLLLPDGRVVAVFRGFSFERPGPSVALSLSDDGGATWREPYRLVDYDGGRYHGGYGDLALCDDGLILAVYYFARRGEAPRVGASRLRLLD